MPDKRAVYTVGYTNQGRLVTMSLRTAPACIDWPIPVGDYMTWANPMGVWQDGRCAFCGYRDRLVRDHDHETGLIRGLLCSGCNTEEPFEWRDPAWNLYRAEGNPAAILGIREVYEPYHLRGLSWATV